MKLMEFDKRHLISVMETNREAHHGLYLQAWDGYCRAARAELETMLERVKEGLPIARHLASFPPEDHTADYDNVIDMLEMCLGDRIELTQTEFVQYVKDNWGWKEQWTASNTTYISG